MLDSWSTFKMKSDPIFRIRKLGEQWWVKHIPTGKYLGYAFDWDRAIDIVCRKLGYGAAYR